MKNLMFGIADLLTILACGNEDLQMGLTKILNPKP